MCSNLTSNNVAKWFHILSFQSIYFVLLQNLPNIVQRVTIIFLKLELFLKLVLHGINERPGTTSTKSAISLLKYDFISWFFNYSIDFKIRNMPLTICLVLNLRNPSPCLLQSRLFERPFCILENKTKTDKTKTQSTNSFKMNPFLLTFVLFSDFPLYHRDSHKINFEADFWEILSVAPPLPPPNVTVTPEPSLTDNPMNLYRCNWRRSRARLVGRCVYRQREI